MTMRHPPAQTDHVLSTDIALQLIADRRRRTVLQVLRERGETGVSIDELVSELADRSRASDHHSIDRVAQTRISLVHNLLPKLNDYGVIAIDPGTGLVKQGPAFEALEPVLDLLRRHAEELPTGYLPEETLVQ